jgi:Asp-tRNA(Asn)/Glu-tRNA(Gln) amidotransferase A subunit family amidase
VGVQLLGPALGEPMLLRIADAFGRATDFHQQLAPTPTAKKKGRAR